MNGDGRGGRSGEKASLCLYTHSMVAIALCHTTSRSAFSSFSYLLLDQNLVGNTLSDLFWRRREGSKEIVTHSNRIFLRLLDR